MIVVVVAAVVVTTWTDVDGQDVDRMGMVYVDPKIFGLPPPAALPFALGLSSSVVCCLVLPRIQPAAALLCPSLLLMVHSRWPSSVMGL